MVPCSGLGTQVPGEPDLLHEHHNVSRAAMQQAALHGCWELGEEGFKLSLNDITFVVSALSDTLANGGCCSREARLIQG